MTTKAKAKSASATDEDEGTQDPASQGEAVEGATPLTDETHLFVKKFVVAVPHDTSNWEGNDHAANVAATIQEAINKGWRAVGDVTFDGAVPQDAEAAHYVQSTVLTYSVEVIPATTLVGDTLSPSDVAEGRGHDEASNYEVVSGPDKGKSHSNQDADASADDGASADSELTGE